MDRVKWGERRRKSMYSSDTRQSSMLVSLHDGKLGAFEITRFYWAVFQFPVCTGKIARVVPLLYKSHVIMLWCDPYKVWRVSAIHVPLMSINEHFYRNLYTFLRTLAKKIIKLIETSSFYDHSNSNISARSSPRRLATVSLSRFGRTGREWVSDVIPGTCSHSDSENC